NAGRALLLPRRHPGRRSPLWSQRKRARDLLQVASKYGSFPLLLETYRECLRDVFDLPGLQEVLRRVQDKRLRVVRVDSRIPSPFAASLLFSYVANFIYDGDAPLPELSAQRRAFAVELGGEKRWVAAEDAARLRDGLGAGVPADLPRELLEPVKDSLGDLVSRWARTHGPFRAEDLAARWGAAAAAVRAALERLGDRVLEGEFLPGGRGRVWVDAGVLKALQRRALARLRTQVEPVGTAASRPT